MTEEVKEIKLMDLIEADTEVDVEVNETQVPDVHSLEWSPFVLSQLAPEELKDGNPTVDGLRRVAELLLGEITESVSDVKHAPSDSDRSATVLHHITINGKTFSGVADVSRHNTDSPYDRYPSSTAETRAEGRALRRALKLRQVVAAEEVSGIREEKVVEENINDTQVNAIDALSNKTRGLDINVNKLIESLCGNKPLSRLTNSEGITIMKKLTEYQRGSEAIPEDMKGYNPDWRNNYGSR